MDLNKVMLIGRLTKNPEVRATPNGQSVTSFAVATNRYFKDASGQKQEKVEFHNIVAWGKLAEICGQYLSKGRRAYVEGRLQTRDWVGQDGVRRYSTEIIADNLILLDSSGAPRGSSPFPSSGDSSQEPSVQPIEEPPAEDQSIETIPF